MIKLFGGSADAENQEQASDYDNGSASWAVVNISVCNLRVKGDYNAGMATQALLGMPMKVLKQGDWVEVCTPYDYIAWVHHRSITLMSKEQLSQWNKSEQVIVTSLCTFVYSEPRKKSVSISDAVAGNRLKKLGVKGAFYYVEFPDGRRGYISRACSQEYKTWRQKLSNDADSIIATALQLNGVSYLWGGTSTKGLDCSGFIWTVFFLHDTLIPRDASQQAQKGMHINISPDFSNLEPGDLIFFGTQGDENTATKVSHVGLYIGKLRFIHSLGWVHVSSFNPKDSEYDEYDLNRLLWAQRIIPVINKDLVLSSTTVNAFYQ